MKTNKIVMALGVGVAFALTSAGSAQASCDRPGHQQPDEAPGTGSPIGDLAGSVCANLGGTAEATGAAVDSPGVLSGNNIQAPIHVPLNVCGNSAGGGGGNGTGGGNNGGGGGGGNN